MSNPLSITPHCLEWIVDPAVRAEFEQLYTYLQKQVHNDRDVTTIIQRTASPGGILSVRSFYDSQSLSISKTPGARYAIVELVGGGGGGAGVASAGVGLVNLGGGGTGASWNRFYIRDMGLLSPAQLVVGAGGAGGAAGDNSGANGTDTTLTLTDGTVLTAGKGFGGSPTGAQALPVVLGGGNGGQGSMTGPGLPDEWDQKTGGHSGVATGASINTAVGGTGGDSFYGTGGNSGQTTGANTSAVGAKGNEQGAGGGGAVSLGTGVARAGGNGTDGVVFLWEWS